MASGEAHRKACQESELAPYTYREVAQGEKHIQNMKFYKKVKR